VERFHPLGVLAGRGKSRHLHSTMRRTEVQSVVPEGRGCPSRAIVASPDGKLAAWLLRDSHAPN